MMINLARALSIYIIHAVCFALRVVRSCVCVCVCVCVCACVVIVLIDLFPMTLCDYFLRDVIARLAVLARRVRPVGISGRCACTT